MKKFMKICAIIALVLVIAGFVLAVTAGTISGKERIKNVVEDVTGGRVRVNLDLKDDDWGITVGEAVGDTVGEVGSAIGELGHSIGADVLDDIGHEVHYDIEDSMIFDHNFSILKGDVEKYCLGNDVSEMKIEVGGCRFEVEESEDDNFYVEAQDIKKFQGYVSNGTLHIRGTMGSVVWKESNSCRITLYVPAGYQYDKADIELGAGIMSTGNLAADEIILEVGAGQIKAEALTTDTLAISVGMGEVTVADMKVENLNGEVGMGHLRLEGSIGRKADVECAMGSVEMVLAGAQSDFDYDIDCGMGNIEIGRSTYSGVSKEKYVDNGADKKVMVECAMGDVNISFTE